MFKYIYRFFSSRPRLLIGIISGVVAYFGLSWTTDILAHHFSIAEAYGQLNSVSKLLLSWNIGVWVYLISIAFMMHRADKDSILDAAHAEDEGTGLMLVLVVLTAIISLVAIVKELGASKGTEGLLLSFHIGLTVLTIVTSWLFIHTMFALHYTHTYYLVKEAKDRETIDFPKEDEPNYWDFLYFSYIIGTSGQTADVSFTSRRSRQLGTLHCVLAFFFNASILALLINIASGLMG